jgi:hypothetical protein
MAHGAAWKRIKICHPERRAPSQAQDNLRPEVEGPPCLRRSFDYAPLGRFAQGDTGGDG